MAKARREPKWILLVYQLPTKPSKLRVRMWRQLRKLGAAAVKNAAYVLPYSEAAQEDFQWVSQEIVDAGGEASLFTADGLETIGDAEVEALFREARARDYEELIAECNKVRANLEEDARKNHVSPERIERYATTCRQLQTRLDQIAAIDFFDVHDKQDALEAVRKLQEAIAECQGISQEATETPGAPVSVEELRGKVWITRQGLHIDRLASAWLITRFVDPNARFKFIAPDQPRQEKKREICFDMYGVELSHHGDDCTFETLLKRLDLTHDQALVHIGQIVHDIDLKDGKFGREEARGVDALVRGLAKCCPNDETLRTAGQQVFDALYSLFQSDTKRTRRRRTKH